MSIGLRSCDCCGTVLDDGRSILQIGDLTINRVFQGVSWKDQVISVTRQQFEVLELLAIRAGRLVPRTAFFISVLGEDVDNKQIDVIVCRLRFKFRAVDPAFDRIYTSRGRGYAWFLADQERLAA